MAIQGRNGKIKGKINNIVYRRLGGQQIMQIAPARVKQTYATKLNALEFGVASAHGKVMRTMFQRVYEVADGKMNGRFNAAIAACLRTSAKEIGERTLHDADLDGLKGFEFNLDAPIGSRILVRPTWGVAPDGLFHFRIPPFNLANDIVYPPGDITMDPSFTIGLIAVHFEQEKVQVIAHETFSFENINRRVEVEWECRKQLPEGYIVMVVFSLRYSSVNWMDKQIYTTDPAFYPTILLDAFHVGPEMAARGKAAGFEPPEEEPVSFGFGLDRILGKVKSFKEKMAKKGK